MKPEAVTHAFQGIIVKPDLSELDRVELPAARDGEERWTRINQRRIHLIDKQFSKGLSATEEAELGQLQALMDSYIDAVHPLPTQSLRELRESVRQAVSGPEQQEESEPQAP